jgi:hypothetical protein
LQELAEKINSEQARHIAQMSVGAIKSYCVEHREEFDEFILNEKEGIHDSNE